MASRPFLVAATALALGAWLPALAEPHDPYGQFKLGSMYRRGIVVEQDFARAIEMYGSTAGRGFAPARAELGYMHAQGEGVLVNLGIAVTMLTRAGVEGGDVDRVEALKWHLLAARHRGGDARTSDLAQGWIPRRDAVAGGAHRGPRARMRGSRTSAPTTEKPRGAIISA